MNTLFNDENKVKNMKTIGNGFGLKKVSDSKFILYRYGIPDREVVFKSRLDKRVFAAELVLRRGVVKKHLAEVLDVSRKTIDVWVDVYQKGGCKALVNSSKQGVGRKKEEEIVRPRGNKFDQYQQDNMDERRKIEEINKLQINIDYSKLEDQPPESELFASRHEWMDNRYAGSFIYWAVFQKSHSVMSLFTWLYEKLNVVIYLFFMMHAVGIETIEQLKTVYKREFGALIGIKQLWSHPVLWDKIHKAVSQERSLEAVNHFFKAQIAKGLVLLWYLFIDGHFIGYTGKEKVHKNYRTQSREMQPGQNELFIHDHSGCIVYFELQEGKGDMVELIHRKSAEYAQLMNNIPPLFVVDRELWGVKKFQYLADCRFVTWEKNTDAKAVNSMEDRYFDKYLRVKDTDYQLYETKQKYKDIEGNSIVLRRIIIWNTKTNKRSVAVTNDTYEDTRSVAWAMLNRWGKSENGFKHMGNRVNMRYNPLHDVTRESADQKIYNPEYSKLHRDISQTKRLLGSIERKIAGKSIKFNKDGSIRKNSSRERLIEARQEKQDKIKALQQQIKKIAQYIDISEEDDYEKFKVISTEAKNLWDLAGSIFWNSRKKLIAIFKEYLPNERDLLPVLEAITKSRGKVKSTQDLIIVKLEPLERPQFRHAQEQLCRHLNQMNVKLHNSKTLMFDVG